MRRPAGCATMTRAAGCAGAARCLFGHAGQGPRVGSQGRLRRRIDDIESGRAKMAFYTLGEHMRHLDRVWGGR